MQRKARILHVKQLQKEAKLRAERAKAEAFEKVRKFKGA